jgi:hypothetical protein
MLFAGGIICGAIIGFILSYPLGRYIERKDWRNRRKIPMPGQWYAIEGSNLVYRVNQVSKDYEHNWNVHYGGGYYSRLDDFMLKARLLSREEIPKEQEPKKISGAK